MSGLKKFTLRQKSDVYDAFTEERAVKNVSEFNDHLPTRAKQLYFSEIEGRP